VAKYGGIPPEVAAEKELMDMFVPILKADFQAHAEYQHHVPQKLDVPVSVFMGENENITYDEASQWQEITTQPVSVQIFSGGHFFIFDHLPEIGNIISRKLERRSEK
jgi:surfactin synthase thioesterase subunit